MEVIAVVAGIIFVAWLIHGLMNNRIRALEDELDEWDGVYDVKREVDNRLNDESERSELRNKYNSK